MGGDRRDRRFPRMVPTDGGPDHPGHGAVRSMSAASHHIPDPPGFGWRTATSTAHPSASTICRVFRRRTRSVVFEEDASPLVISASPPLPDAGGLPGNTGSFARATQGLRSAALSIHDQQGELSERVALNQGEGHASRAGPGPRRSSPWPISRPPSTRPPTPTPTSTSAPGRRSGTRAAASPTASGRPWPDPSAGRWPSRARRRTVPGLSSAGRRDSAER